METRERRRRCERERLRDKDERFREGDERDGEKRYNFYRIKKKKSKLKVNEVVLFPKFKENSWVSTAITALESLFEIAFKK
jgi:hypothetical protein